jgi:protein TonB
MKNIFLAAVAAAGACVLFACNSSSDYKNTEDSISKQGAVIQQSNVDTNAMNNGSTSSVNRDSLNAHGDTTANRSIAAASSKTRPNPAKKGHKGTVRMAVYSPDAKARIEADKNGVYNYAEVLPAFPGGEKVLERFVHDNIQYPQDALDNGVEGTVTVTFAVDEQGKIYSPGVKEEKLGYGLDEEAMNVVKKMPKWTPGRIKGKNVKTYYELPITFTLL